jgi:uncharacterized protein YnzC (UPF0291/DUF896 family)
MSTTVPNVTYDDCIVLFSDSHTGPNKDHRSKLFLHELKNFAQDQKNKASHKNYAQTHLDIDVSNMESTQAIYFKDDKKYGLGDSDLHVEWVFWLTSVMNKRSTFDMTTLNGPNKNNSGTAILNLIRSLANAQPGSFDELVALFIRHKLLLSLISSTNPNLLDTRSQWGSATDFRFKDLTPAANNLITHRFVNAVPPGVLPANATSLHDRAVRILTNIVILVEANNSANVDPNHLLDLLTLTSANTANGVLIAKYTSWSQIVSPLGPGQIVIEASNHPSFTNPNAHTNLINFINAYTNNAIGVALGNAAALVGPTPQVTAANNAYNLIIDNLVKKITIDCLSATQFGWKQDAFMLKRLFKSLKNVKVPISNWFQRPPVSGSATISNEKYYRKSIDGKIWERLANGTDKCVDASDPTVFASLKEDDKCFGLGVEKTTTNSSGVTVTCAEYFKDCITGGDVAQCKNFLTSSTFWQNAAKEVDNMLPELAYHTLKSFQFETYDEFSKQAKRSFKMVQSWSQWLEACEKSGKLTPNEKTQISQNVKLQEYLNAIIKKVNDNPTILNKDYYGDKPADLSSVFKGTLLGKRGLTYEVVPKNTDVSTVLRLSNAISDSQKRAVISLGQNIHPSVRLVLTGGAPSLTQLKADIIQSQFDALKARLRQINKGIESGDETKIMDLINQLRTNELKLNEFIVFTDRYADLIQVFGQTDKETSLTLDHMEEFTKARDNYFKKVSRKQNSLMSIIQAIADKVNDISNKSTPDTRKTSTIQ